ncbi:hypothetical protein WH52_08440 [Tenacibaculum holothuriorum]|uniref:Secretion system C-terminal sorting domain-containing protein n=1 Tax=Tenacibaculum holothuriorum TaxID=1635173 RepID=A0A1Y2PE20_9FLAO|nr:T9SS type A sorting domain-containing protein [Tenacibaculum holothuriorum]OSY88047.1 hypothetical protein WH52_08440 [Tenacibaculum holothuriorum]
MKNYYYLSFIFLILKSSFLTAQEYTPIIKNGSFWDVETVLGGHCSRAYYRYKIGNDTIISGKSYKKLLYAEYTKTSNDPCPEYKTPYVVNQNDFVELQEYIREDIAEKKVYIWTNNNSQNIYKEYILYDFNLNINDVLSDEYYANANNTSSQVKIVKIDTDSNGKKRHHLETDTVYYTEGIGSYSGIISFNRVVGEGDTTLFCHGNSTNQNNCAAVLSTNKEALLKTIISPNPVNDVITIHNLPHKATYIVYNVLGKQIPIKKKTFNTLNTSALAKGIYFLKISTSNNTQKTIKFFKD